MVDRVFFRAVLWTFAASFPRRYAMYKETKQ
jgi:hypothetical protein